MTKDFSFRRLLLLIKKQWIESAKLYLYGTLALLGLLGVIFLFWLNTGGHRYNEEALIIIFFIGLLLSGAIFASTSFNMLSSKAKGIYWLSFPASHLEKLICLIFYNLVVFTVVYCICFFLIEQTAVSYIHHLVKSDPAKYSFDQIDWEHANTDRRIIHDYLCGFFAVQALYLLGSVYFRRYSFILTTIITAFVFFCFILLMGNLKNLLPDDYYLNMGRGFFVMNNTSPVHRVYDLNHAFLEVLIFLFKFIWAPFFWLVTWFRLKEKEI